MSIFTTVILPELEKQIIKEAPEIIEYLINNTAAVAGHMITYINSKIDGANHGKEFHPKGD